MTSCHPRVLRHAPARIVSLLFPPRRRRESAFEWLVADPVFERVVAVEDA